MFTHFFPCAAIAIPSFAAVALRPLVLQDYAGLAIVILMLILAMTGTILFFYAILQDKSVHFADRVIQSKDGLVARTNGKDVELPFQDILDVQYSGIRLPSQIRLILKPSSVIKKPLVFIPPLDPLAILNHPVASELANKLNDKTEMRPPPSTDISVLR